MIKLFKTFLSFSATTTNRQKDFSKKSSILKILMLARRRGFVFEEKQLKYSYNMS